MHRALHLHIRSAACAAWQAVAEGALRLYVLQDGRLDRATLLEKLGQLDDAPGQAELEELVGMCMRARGVLGLLPREDPGRLTVQSPPSPLSTVARLGRRR